MADNKGYALITGATSGLGLAYARWFAGAGYNLVVTGRRRQVIEMRAEEIRREHGCNVRVVLADLAEKAGVDVLLESVRGLKIEVLVNNAGFGLKTSFADTAAEDMRHLLYLQTAAVAELTHYVLQGMRERNEGTVINISSDGAFAVIPGNVLYSATKRFIIELTEGLHMELAHTRIRVQAVCPGFMDSHFHESAGMAVDKGAKGIFAFRRPEDVAEDAMKDLARGKVVSIPDMGGKLFKALGIFMPRKLYYRFAGRFADKSFRKSR